MGFEDWKKRSEACANVMTCSVPTRSNILRAMQAAGEASHWSGGLEPMQDEDLEMMRAAALLVSAGHCGAVRPTREQAETMARGLVELADEVRRLKSVLRAIADPMSFKHRGTPLALCRIYEDMAQEALGSNDLAKPPGAALCDRSA